MTKASSVIRAGRMLALVIAASTLALTTSSAEPIRVSVRPVAAARVDPTAALATTLNVLDRRLAGAEQTRDGIDRAAWALRADSRVMSVRMSQAEDALRRQVQEPIPSRRSPEATAGEVGKRIDVAFRRLGQTLESVTVRVTGMRARLASTRRDLEALQAEVDRQVRGALQILADIRTQAFREAGSSPLAELVGAGRRVLVRLMVLKRDVATLRAGLLGLADGLGRQRRSADHRLESALAKEASAFGLPFDGLPRGEGESGIFLVCPVDPPRTVYDDFGAVRTGGGYHLHQGNDIAAPMGTPVRAPFSGTAVESANGLGGLAVKVFGLGGFVYNAHLSAYGNLGPVQAGEVIGYVGNTGNASGGPPHDHFEWHPGGGDAVDPHLLLMEVCGPVAD